MVKLDFAHGGEIAEFLLEVPDDDLRHAYSGKWLTMMNITVPTSVVMKE